MNKLNIVIDTNVFLVSLASNFRLHWIFQAILLNKFTLSVSTEILFEYEEIIQKRYGLDKTDSTLEFLLLLPNIQLITPFYKWNLSTGDADDNKFIDCAVAANADFVISNDKDLRRLNPIEFPPISIISADEFDADYKAILGM
jgi:uncharacterized protein